MPRLAPTIVTVLISLAVLSFATGAQAQICESMAKDPAYRSLLDPSPPAIEGATAYDYKVVGARALRLYVFGAAKPDDRPGGPRPTIVFLFGGGWVAGNVSQYIPQARYFAARGMVTVLADYRVFCRDHATIIDEMSDVKASVRWVRAHATELGVDPSRIAVSGQSSGGHLALTTAMFEDLDPDANRVSARPDLLLLFYPCVDITSPQDRIYSVFVAGAHGQDVSPLFHVTGGLPPTIIFHGDADPLYAGARLYCDREKAAGNACEFVTFEGAPHGFFFAPDPKHDWYERGLHGMERYLVAAGYLAAKS